MSNIFDRGFNRLFLDRNSGRSVDQVLISGSVGIVQAGFTIPPAGSVAVPVSPSSLLADGANDFFVIKGVLGTLSRSGAVYTFSPSFPVPAPVTVSPNDRIWPAAKSTDPSDLSVINSKRRGKYPFLILDSLKKLIFAIRFDGVTVAPFIESRRILLGKVSIEASTSYRDLIALVEDRKNVLVSIMRTGTLFANKVLFNKLDTGKAFREKGCFSIIAEKKVVARFEEDGQLWIHKIHANQLSSGIIAGKNKLKPDGAIHVFIWWGQSNGTGLTSDFTERGQRYRAYMLRDTNPSSQFNGAYSTLTLAPMIEPFRGGGGQYPQNVYGQTPSTMFHRNIAELFLGSDFEAFYDTVAIPSQPYSGIKKGGTTNAYASGLYILQAIVNLATAQGKRVIVPWCPGIHGEADFSNVNYDVNLLEHHANINADWKPITGQQESIPLAIVQQSAFPYNSGNIPYTKSWTAARDNPGAIILVEPRYQYHCSDVAHLDAWSTRRSGGKWAQVFNHVIVERKSWRPLQPISTTVSGSTIKIKFDVPYGALRFYRHFTQPASININGSYVTNPWLNGHGFEVNGASNAPISITKAEITAHDEITLTLGAGTPTVLRYALSRPYNGVDLIAGPETSCRGTVCDSDPFVGDDCEVIRCGVTNGSPTITSAAKFVARGWYDRVSGLGLPKDAIIKNRVNDSTLTLSDSWTGATGTVDFLFWHEQSNFLVQFELPL